MSRLKCGKLVVKPSSIHGLGVFAQQTFARGDLIEECPTFKIEDQAILDVLAQGEHHLHNYTQIVGDDVHIMLGNGSLYNHANKPNAALTFNPTRGVMQIHALAAISKGQEILLHYGQAWHKAHQARIVQPKENLTLLQSILRLPLVKLFIFVSLLSVILHWKFGV